MITCFAFSIVCTGDWGWSLKTPTKRAQFFIYWPVLVWVFRESLHWLELVILYECWKCLCLKHGWMCVCSHVRIYWIIKVKKVLYQFSQFCFVFQFTRQFCFPLITGHWRSLVLLFQSHLLRSHTFYADVHVRMAEVMGRKRDKEASLEAKAQGW